MVSSNAFHSTNTINTHISVYKPHTTHNSLICSDKGLTLETSAFEFLYGGQFTLKTKSFSNSAGDGILQQSKETNFSAVYAFRLRT